MTLRPLDLVPGDDDAVEESLSVRLPAACRPRPGRRWSSRCGRPRRR